MVNKLKVSYDTRKGMDKLNRMPRVVIRGGVKASKELAREARNKARSLVPVSTGHLKNQIKMHKRKTGYQVISGARVRSGRYSGFPYSKVIEDGRKGVVVNVKSSPELMGWFARHTKFTPFGTVHLKPYTGKKYMHQAFLSAKRKAPRIAKQAVEKELKQERIK